MARLVVCAAITLLAASCKEPDNIRTYTELREAKVEVVGKYRTIGAMLPPENPVWFFKISGADEDVKKAEKDFDTFLASLDMKPGEELPLWKLPPGWTETGPKSIHAQTIRVPGDNPLELTVTPAKGGVESNAGRWLEQLGRVKPTTVDGYKQYLKDFGMGPNKGVKFNAAGPKQPGMGGGMMGRPR